MIDSPGGFAFVSQRRLFELSLRDKKIKVKSVSPRFAAGEVLLSNDTKVPQKSDAHEDAGCAGPLRCSVQAGGFELAPLKQAKPLFPPGPARLGAFQG